jgi:chromosome segregation and condensation protein ScpB
MSFDPRFAARFADVIQPAIEAEPIDGVHLLAQRVDISKTGDSILTEIVNGIAHARLVLADISVIDEGRYTQVPIRNANVMYEVGIALACRAPSDVLLVRDDNKALLFDLSTIPTIQIDFQNVDTAVDLLRKAIVDRVSESTLLADARVRLAAQSLTQYELNVLSSLSTVQPSQARDLSIPGKGQPSIPTERGLATLLSRGFVRAVGRNSESGGIFYHLTPLGIALAKAVDTLLQKLEPLKPKAAEDGSTPAP